MAPLEKAMMQSSGLTSDSLLLLTRLAGIAEILFGLFFLIFYKTKLANFLNIFLLSVLLILAAIQFPPVLIEAFNPVTTNIPLIGLSLVVLNELKPASLNTNSFDCSDSK